MRRVIWLQTPSVLARWRNHFSQILNIQGANDVRQTEIRSAETLVPEPSASEVEMAIEKLKRHKSPGIDQIPAEFIQQGVEQFAMRSRSLLIRFGIRRNCLGSGRS
jgi:hypothetical protein